MPGNRFICLKLIAIIIFLIFTTMYFTDIDEDFLYGKPELVSKSNEYAYSIDPDCLSLHESQEPIVLKKDQSQPSETKSRFSQSFGQAHYEEEVQSVWLKSIKAKKDRIKSYIKNTKSYKEEGSSKTKQKPYTYFVAKESAGVLDDYFAVQREECQYRMVSSYNEPANRISEFENQVDLNKNITSILANSSNINMFYRNVTESIYVLATQKSNSSSNDAKVEVSLVRIDGQQATDTELYHLSNLDDPFGYEEMQRMMESQQNQSESFFDTLIESFNMLSNDLDYFYMLDPLRKNYDMSNALKMDLMGQASFEGEILAQSFSHTDQIYCFVHATANETVLTHFDLRKGALNKTSSYVFADSPIISSLTCGKNFAIYSKLFDTYKLRELKFDKTANKWIEKCHSEERNGLYESVALNYFKDQDNIHVLNSRILLVNETKMIQLEISHRYEYEYSDDRCILHNQTMFQNPLNLQIDSVLKTDILDKPYSIKSSHSGKSFLVTMERYSVHSIDWNEKAGVFQYFDSFKQEEGLIDILANNHNNSVFIAHLRDTDSMYLIFRDKNKSADEVSEVYHKLLSQSFYEAVGKAKVKDMRVESIPRGKFEDLVLLCVFENGVFASFDLNFI